MTCPHPAFRSHTASLAASTTLMDSQFQFGALFRASEAWICPQDLRGHLARIYSLVDGMQRTAETAISSFSQTPLMVWFVP
jgi:hypothetical protein